MKTMRMELRKKDNNKIVYGRTLSYGENMKFDYVKEMFYRLASAHLTEEQISNSELISYEV